MTDQELRDLVASLAVKSDRLDAQMAKTDAQMAKTDAQMAKTNAQMARTDAQLARSDKKWEQTIKKLDNLGVMLANYGIVQGEMTEEMVYRGLQNLFGNIGKDFDEIAQNLKKKGEGEFDIVAVNGSEVLVTEVKTKVRRDDIDTFVKKRLPRFKQLFPKYQGYDILGAIGGNIFREDLENYAAKNGLYVIRQSGDNLQLANKSNFSPKVFA